MWSNANFVHRYICEICNSGSRKKYSGKKVLRYGYFKTLLRYGYAVQDGDTGNDFNQQEQSNGDEVPMHDDCANDVKCKKFPKSWKSLLFESFIISVI